MNDHESTLNKMEILFNLGSGVLTLFVMLCTDYGKNAALTNRKFKIKFTNRKFKIKLTTTNCIIVNFPVLIRLSGLPRS